MPITATSHFLFHQRKKRYDQQPKKEKDAFLDLDTKIRHSLSTYRDKFYIDDWMPRQGSEDYALLITYGLEEFVQGIMEEEEKMAKTWKAGNINLTYAKLWIDEGKGVLCARFPFNQGAINEFKEKIPKGKKAWNADEKLWEFSVETIDVVVDILTRHFDEVIDLRQLIPPMQISQSVDPLLSLLDKDDITAIYRMLAFKYHPDKGGDAGKMARINQIFNQIKNGG